MDNTIKVEMTKDEKSLLLFFESCSVDNNSKVKSQCMNSDDFRIADSWNENGFISFGRIYSGDVNQYGNYWCQLTDEAWTLASEERKARAKRLWEKRPFLKSSEAI